MKPSTFARLDAALSGPSRRFSEVSAVRGARSWDSSSRRGWYHLEDVRTAKQRGARPDPLFVLKDGELFVPASCWKLLGDGLDPRGSGDQSEEPRVYRIGRREYVPVAVEDLVSAAYGACRDDFLTRDDSARNCADTLDICSFGLSLLGTEATVPLLREALPRLSSACRIARETLQEKLSAESAGTWPPPVGKVVAMRSGTAEVVDWFPKELRGETPVAEVTPHLTACSRAEVLSVSGDLARVVSRWTAPHGEMVEERDLSRESWIDCAGFALT